MTIKRRGLCLCFFNSNSGETDSRFAFLFAAAVESVTERETLSSMRLRESRCISAFGSEITNPSIVPSFGSVNLHSGSAT